MPASRHRALLTALLLMPLAASAHTGMRQAGFSVGFAHPFGGIDHLLAMIAVGALAMRFDGWQRWLLPVSFLSAMIFGGVLGATHVTLPFVEGFIALSLVVFGGTLLIARTPRFAVAAIAVGAFAIFHGHAHGTEMGGASPLSYGIGFVVATALLHAAGMLVASRLTTPTDLPLAPTRVAGAIVAVVGVGLMAV